MPGARIADVLAAAELDDTPENRSLVEQIAEEEGADLAPEFETDFAQMQQPGAPAQTVKTTRPSALLGDTSFGETGEFELPQDTLRPPVTSPQEALGRAGMRFGIGAIEGTVKPFLQTLGEVSETVQREFPGGHLGLGDELERANLLGEATHAERFAEKVGEGAGFFAPISGVGRALRAANVVKPWAKFLIEPALVTMAAVLDGRSQTDRSLREGDWRPTPEDWKTFGTSIALLPAGALVGLGVVKGVNRLLKTPLSEEVKHLVSNSAVGAAFGAYSGHQGKLGRDELTEEVLAGALSFAIGGQVARVFAGDLRPNTQRQADRAAELVTDAIEKHGSKSKFESLIEEQSKVDSYGLRKHAAEIFWTNSAAKEGERPTFEQVKTAFRLTDADARKIVTTKVAGAELAEAKENMRLQAEREAAYKQGPEALQAKLIEQGVMPEAERKIVESRAGAAKPGTIESEVAGDLRRPEGTTPLFDAKGKIIPPAKQPTDRFVGSGVDVPSSEATARLEGIQPARPTLVTPVERVGQPRSQAPAPIPPMRAPRQYPMVRTSTDPVQPPVTVRTPQTPGPSSYPVETPQTEILRQRQGLGRKPRVRVGKKAGGGPGATPGTRAATGISAPPTAPTIPEAGRQAVAPGKIPPPSQAPAAPVAPLSEGQRAAQRFREINARLGTRGLPPEERAALHQEKTALLGSDLPLDPGFSKNAKVGEVMRKKPQVQKSPVEVEARATMQDPKASPKEKRSAAATIEGGKEAQKSADIIHAAKPAELLSSDATFTMGVDPVAAAKWMNEARRRLPKINPPEYKALNDGKPGPRAIERWTAEIEDLFHKRFETRQERDQAVHELVQKFSAEVPALKRGRYADLGDTVEKFVVPTIEFVRAHGNQSETAGKIADAMMRQWSWVLSTENNLVFDLSKQQMKWGAHKRGRVKNWLTDLTPDESKNFAEWQDARAMGETLPKPMNDNVRMMAAAWERARYGRSAPKIKLTEQETKIVDGFTKFLREKYGWLHNEGVDAGLPTKTYVGSNPEGQYIPTQLAERAFVPRVYEDFVSRVGEKVTAWVNTDQGTMTKAEYVTRRKHAEKIQAHIIKEMTAKVDKNGNQIHTEVEVQQRLREYQDRYHDPYAQPISERFQQGIHQPESNLTLHRYFDVLAGTEGDLGKLFKQYLRSNLLTIASARDWGAQRERLRAQIEVVGLEGGNRKSLAEAIDVAMMQDPIANRTSGKFMSEARGWTLFSKLGKTVAYQIPQNVMIAAYTGFEAYAKGIPKTLRARIYTDPNLPIVIRQRLGDELMAKYVAMSGALVESELHTTIQQLHGWGPKAAAFMLSKTGMRASDQFNRAHAAIAGKIYAEKVLYDYRYGTTPKAKDDAEAKIKELWRDKKDVAYALSGEWLKDAAGREFLVAMAGESVAYRTQFRTLPIDMPLARSDGNFRAMYDLKGFSYQATREMHRVLSLREGSPLRHRATALRWLSGLMASGAVSAWFVGRLKEALFGEDPENDPWLRRQMQGLISVAFFPIYFDLWKQAKGAYGNKNPSSLLLGPYAEYAGEQVKAGAQAISQKSTKPLYRQAAKNIPKTPYERVIGPTIRNPLAERGAEPQGRRKRVRVRVRRRQPATAD